MGDSMRFLERVRGAEGPADHELVRRTRRGDRAAYAELWRRHHHAGLRVARAVTHRDADDIVAEAFARILRIVLAGGGPEAAFRPYLYTTIKNVAASQGRATKEFAIDDLEVLLDPGEAEDEVAISALDRSLTAHAFRSLPERWQTVLWYTEVEGLDPHEAAPLLGLSANATAALSFRAREGLRVAWLQAHVDAAQVEGECRWAVEHLGEHERNRLRPRDAERLAFHLANCAHCAIVSEELHDVGARLHTILLPLVAGAGAGGAFALTEQGTEAVFAAEALPPAGTTPDLLSDAALPESVAAVFGAVSAGTAALVAKVAAGTVIAIVGAAGSIAATQSAVDTTDQSAVGDQGGGHSQGGSATADESEKESEQSAAEVVSIPDPVDDETAEAGDAAPTVGGLVGDLVDGITDTITGAEPPAGHTAPGGIVGADINLTLTGTATPGAHLSLQAAGQVYATTTVNSNGTFAIAATGVPGGLSSLSLVQTVDEGYLATLLPGMGGLLGGLTGTVDALIQALIKPIALGSNDSSISIVIAQ